MDRDTGFTLVELLITIVVVSILLAMGAPAFKDFIKNNRVTAQANDLVTTIQLARNEALKRGTVMVVCASNNQATCTGKDTWLDGMIAFSDLNRDGAPDIGTGKCLETEDCIILTRKGLSSGSTLTTLADNVRFLPAGLADNNYGVKTKCGGEETVRTAMFTIKAKNCEKSQAREICITQVGHTSVRTVDCS